MKPISTRERAIFILFFIATIVWGQTPTFSLNDAFDEPKREVRAVWITVLNGLDWPRNLADTAEGRRKQQAEICEQLDAFKAANFNMVLMQTRVRGSLIYPSKLEPMCEELTGKCGGDPGYDPLQFIIDECHKRGMEFHAWIVAIPMGADKKLREQGRLPELRKRGSLFIQSKYGWYLNPGNPAAKEYLGAIVREIVERYDVDGISFDYIRYPEKKARFNDVHSFGKYGKGRELADWRRDNLTEMVSYIYQEVKAIKPYVKVSSSPLGKYRDTQRFSSGGWNAYHAVFQDGKRWLEDGIHDAVFPMLYYRDKNYYPFLLDWQESANGRWIVPGLGVYFIEEANWPLADIERQIYFSRSSRAAGQAYFRAKFLLRNCGGSMRMLSEEAYRHPALVPPMTWGDSIPPSQPTNLRVTMSAEGQALVWGESSDNNRRSATDTGIRYHVYRSRMPYVDTSRGANLYATALTATAFPLPAEEGWHYAVTATDVFGNESEAARMGDAAAPMVLAQRNTLDATFAEGCSEIVVEDIWGRRLALLPYAPQIEVDGWAAGVYKLRGIDENGEERCAVLRLVGE